MIRKIILVLLFTLLALNSYAASTITLPVYNNSATTQTGKYVQFSAVPIAYADSTSTIDDLIVSSDAPGSVPVDAQFHVISRYDNDLDGADAGDRIRTVMCVFAATVTGSSNVSYYLQVDPGSGTGGTVAGTDIASNEAGYHQISTGALVAKLTESAGFNVFDSVTVDATEVISSPASDGIVLRSDNSGSPVNYTSYSSNDAPTLSIEYNGPLFALVKVSGHLEDSSNNTLIPAGSNPSAVNPISYDLWYAAYKDDRKIHLTVRLKNENPGQAAAELGMSNKNVDIDYFGIHTTLANLGTITEVDFGNDASAGWEDVTSPSGDYWAYQTHCLPGTCAQASESDGVATPNFNYYIKEGATTRYTGRRFDTYSQLRDANRGVMVALEYHWQQWPADINIDATNKTVDVYLIANAAADHVFLGAAWKTWNLVYDFHNNVASNYSFAAELSEIKNPLKILLGDQVANSQFYADFTFAETATTGITLAGGESIDDAVEQWQNSMKAMYDSAYNTSGTFTDDLDDVREFREASSTSGVYNGPVDMYGWLNFGDWARGNGGWGMNGLQYGWNYLSFLNAHRFKLYGPLKIGEQMSMKTVDQLMMHQPINDATIINSSSASVRALHGGSRGELDATTAVRNYTGSYYQDSAVTWKHGFPQGVIYEYILTGKPWLKAGMDDMGDFLRYNYSAINPDHGQFTGPRPGNNYDCVTDTGTYWHQEEARKYVRTMGMAIGLFQATGDIDYYNIAKGIFTNVILGVEGGTTGYLGDGGDDVYMWQCMQPIKYTIMLYNLANEINDTTTKNAVAAYLTRLGNWFERVMEEDMATPAGTYSGGNYYAYYSHYHWDEVSGFDGALDKEYVHELADLYAFLSHISAAKSYNTTAMPTWILAARHCFTDQFYYTPTGSGEAVNTTIQAACSDGSECMARATNGPTDSAWMKRGKMLIRPMYWMWLETTGGVTPPVEPDPPGPTYGMGSGAASTMTLGSGGITITLTR